MGGVVAARGDRKGGVMYGGVGDGAVKPRGVPVVRCHWLDTHSGQAALNSIEG